MAEITTEVIIAVQTLDDRDVVHVVSGDVGIPTFSPR
jgi:hypothetical protein